MTFSKYCSVCDKVLGLTVAHIEIKLYTHDFSPVQALNPLSVLLITRTVARVEMHGVIEWGDGVE